MRRRSSTALMVVTSNSSSRIRPPVGSTNRLIMRSTVDLPQPDGPMRTTSSPAGMSSESGPTATVPSGYVLPTPSSVIGAAAPFGVPSAYVPSGLTGSGLRRGGQSVVLLALRPGEPGYLAGRAARTHVVDRRSCGAGRTRGHPARRAGVLVPSAHRTDSRIHRRALHDSVAGTVRAAGPVPRSRAGHGTARAGAVRAAGAGTQRGRRAGDRKSTRLN